MAKLLCSVIVPTFNRWRSLLKLLDSLALQDLPMDSFEVLVVDDGSTDDTWSRLCELQMPYELRLLSQSNQGPAAARNAGIREARGDLIVTLDDDVITTPGALRHHVAAHALEPDIAAIGVMAPAKTRKMTPWSDWEMGVLKNQYRAMTDGTWVPTPRQFYTGNASVSRKAIIAAGMFDPFFRRSEDMELAYRLRQCGLRFQFLRDAIVYHDPPRSFDAWKRMARGLGYYELEIWRRQGEVDLNSQIRREFQWRRSSARSLIRLLVGRPWMVSAFVFPASVSAHVLYRLGLRVFSYAAYSSIFQLLYWHGVCESLGSRRDLLDKVANGRAHAIITESSQGPRTSRP